EDGADSVVRPRGGDAAGGRLGPPPRTAGSDARVAGRGAQRHADRLFAAEAVFRDRCIEPTSRSFARARSARSLRMTSRGAPLKGQEGEQIVSPLSPFTQRARLSS